MTTERRSSRSCCPAWWSRRPAAAPPRDCPPPARGRRCVQVEATGVSFAEQQMRHGSYPGQPQFPFVPGYDLVGTVAAVGAGGRPALVGTRVAAVTKTGGWATHVACRRRRPDPRPRGARPGRRRRPSSSTASPPGRCCTGAPTSRPGRPSWCTARTAASARARPARPTRRRAGHRHRRRTTPRRAARPRRRTARLPRPGRGRPGPRAGAGRRRRRLRPGRRPGRTHLVRPARPRRQLVVYGNAAAVGTGQSVVWVFVKLLARLYTWNALPNGHRAGFYNFWAGHSPAVPRSAVACAPTSASCSTCCGRE